MMDFLKANGIDARVKFLHDGSLKGCWRLYNGEQAWDLALCNKLSALGFSDFDGTALNRYSGNGGVFSVFVRGHVDLV